MTNEHSNGGDDKTSRTEKVFSEDAIEQTKQTLVHRVGYKSPPQHTRFKKGQTGNPKGRPKTLGLDSGRSANAIALKEGERLITVREGTETREMPTIDSVFRKQAATALGGNAYAQKHVIERYARAELERRQRIASEIEFWTSYVEMERAEIAEAKAKGQLLPDPLPHPDDVVIDYERGVRFIGPFSEDGRALIDENIQVRDILIMQHALDQRMADEVESTDLLDQPGSAFAFALFMNTSLPARHRLSTKKIELRAERYATWSKRKLLKDVYRAWRALGVTIPRGYTFPPFRYAKQKIDRLLKFAAEGHDEIARFAALPAHIQIDAMGITRRKQREE